MILNKSNKKQVTLIVLCWAIYTFAYFGKYSYTCNGVPIKRFYGVSSDEFSLATTFFFFAYGAGQIINGLICGKYNLRYMLTGALILSSAINISVYLGLPFYLIKYAWLVNGLCQAILWPSILRVLSCNLDEKYTKIAVIVMSTTTSVGILFVYGTSALFALFDGFKYSFLLAAVFMTGVAMIWLFSYGKVTEKTKIESYPALKAETYLAETKGSVQGLIFILMIFGVYAVATNFIKDGLSTWVPHVLSEQYFLTDSLSIILTLVLPLFGIFGAMSSVFLNKFIKEHSDLTGVFFALSALSTTGIVLLFKTEYWYIILVLFGLVNMFMFGANNVVTTMLPMKVGKKYNAGLIGGILNGACYMGSALSQYVIAAIAAATGWNTVMSVLLYLCIFAVAISLSVHIIKVYVEHIKLK